jgi:transposase
VPSYGSIRYCYLGSLTLRPVRGVTPEEPAAGNLHGGVREGGDCWQALAVRKPTACQRVSSTRREKLRFLGMDVHAETIAVAVAEPDREVRSLGTIANREDSIRKFIRKLGSPEHLRVCYEAGPTGFVLYWQMAQLGVKCDVVAPSLVPKKPGDKVKTDRRDALKLARSHRSGDLTAVWIPDEASEALRDLVRAREAAKQDQLRARHRLTKFLLRTGQRPPQGVKAWTARYMEWVLKVRYTHPAREATLLDCLNEVEHMAARVTRLEKSIVEVIQLAPASMQEVVRGLQALRGIAHISAVTIAVELGNITSRFEGARDLMGYSGAFPSEDSSGKRIRRGGITKSGNAHLRRIVVESAWSYRYICPATMIRDTSLHAFRKVKISKSQDAVLKIIRAHPEGLTDAEINHYLGYNAINRITPRRGELLKMELIYYAGTRECRKTHEQAHAYKAKVPVLPPAREIKKVETNSNQLL